MQALLARFLRETKPVVTEASMLLPLLLLPLAAQY